MGIPLQHQMDMDKPEEHLLWGLVNIGGLAGVPLLLDERFMRIWSKHLYRCGFRHHPELQELWYKPPTDDATLFQGIGGEWVESEPGVMPALYSKDEILQKMVTSMSDDDKLRLAELLGGDDGGHSGE
ncbi:phage gene 29 protein family protein [Corynebacterium heidelbergense]|uniref:DUF2744 domain-containing protein n=1 Tax=Corynebacterium heidelbergense TaxID=2055947 RepID=A0A364VE56_9CORY|nr:DUF2744 domain-containing protein [Corynebacterium heidelbergense]RAV34929.1 hypothetical protein CWC39_00905 [Corynebacterium heidelbergense]WCZ36068.1 hypothetical protein CHEID_02510 [Corynebacterium heidelbergense]